MTGHDANRIEGRCVVFSVQFLVSAELTVRETMKWNREGGCDMVEFKGRGLCLREAEALPT